VQDATLSDFHYLIMKAVYALSLNNGIVKIMKAVVWAQNKGGVFK